MLERIDSLSSDVANIIIYTNSAVLQSFLKKRIKERYGILRNTTKYADTGALLKEVKNETFTPPFGGGIWFVDIETDKINLSDLGKALNQVSNSAINVYWVKKYTQYKKICDLDVVKKQGIYCFQMYMGKLYPEDITYLHNKLVPEDKRLPKPLLDYLKKNYTYNVDSVCKVLKEVAQGEKINTTKDIVFMVGLGGNTVDSFVMKLLTSNPKTEKGYSKSFENSLVLLNDLSYTLRYDSIKNFMKSTINTILSIKQLQIMGKYSYTLKRIPENGYNTEKIQKLSRYDSVILDEINISRVLLLKLSLDKFTDYNSEIALIQGISEYLYRIYKNNEGNPESKEKFERRRRVR